MSTMDTRSRKRLKTASLESDLSTTTTTMMTQQQKQDMERALLNPLILDTIMPYLSFIDLKSCRSVSKIFKDLSSSIMRKRDCCRIKFSWSGQRSGFCQYHHEKGDDDVRESHSIDKLTQLVQTSVNFPCTDYYFCGVDNLEDDEDSNEFFEVYGVHIKSLEFTSSWFDENPPTLHAALHKIVVQQCPHLDTLTLSDCPYEDDDEELSLPSLKIFNWMDVGQDSVHGIVRAAPNLQKVDGFDMDEDLDVFLECNKIHTVKSLRFGVKDSLDSLQKFVAGGPRLEKLSLCDWDRDGLEVVQKLLQVNRQTLEFLELGRSRSTSINIQIPVLNNLKSLKLDYNSTADRHWPPGINLTKTFPHLSCLDITGLETHTEVNWNLYFPASSYTGNLACVDTLKTGVCTAYWMEKLSDLCPNFKKLVLLPEDYTITYTLPRVFRIWTDLESIEIWGKCHMEQPAYFDPLFTGLSEFTCQRLADPDLYDEYEDEVIDMTRNAPSIVNLEGLKNLLLKFYCANGSGVSLPITTVSAIYGFKLLPNLKVTIESDHTIHDEWQESEFQAMAPFATLRRNAPCPS